jgi:hypothetical protein
MLVVRHAYVLALIAGTVTSQQLLVVDSRGGAGSHFRSIAPAIAAARPGDHVVVRPGSYTEPLLEVDKGIALIGGAGTELRLGNFTGVVVRDIPAGESFRMRGFTLIGPFELTATIDVRGCVGPCAFQQLTGWSGGVGLRVTSCQQVAFRGITAYGAAFTNSTVAMTLSYVQGTFHGLTCSGRVSLDRCTVRCPDPFAQAGIQMNSGRLLITRSEVTTNANSGVPQPAINALGGEIVLDPTARLVPAFGAPPVQGPATLVTRQFASLDADVAGSSVQLELHGIDGSDFVVIATTPAPVLPTPFGDLWLAARDHVLVDFGVLRNQVRTHNKSIPAAPVAPGSTVALQAALLHRTGLSLSTPAVLVFP